MRASDFTNDMSEEVQDVGSGFDPDAFGGVEMALMGSGEEVAGLLGSGGRRQKPGVKQEGLIKASRDKTCVYLLFMAAAWALLLVVAALSSSLEPAFPRTPPNEDAPGVPVLPLTPAPWLVQATEYGKGGDVLEHLEQGPTNTTSPRLCQGAQMFSTGCLGSVVGYDGAEDSEALSGVLEGSVRPGSWKFFRYRLGNVTRAGEVHLRLPALTNLLSNATCSGAVRGAVALARVGEKPSLQHHDASSCNGCSLAQQPDAQGAAKPCPLVCGPHLWIYLGIFAPPPEQTERAEQADAALAGSSAAVVAFEFQVAVSGRAFTHPLDLPSCGFAEQGFAPRWLYWVFLPALFVGLPTVALLFGCGVIRAWRMHMGDSGMVLQQLKGPSRTERLARRGAGDGKGR